MTGSFGSIYRKLPDRKIIASIAFLAVVLLPVAASAGESQNYLCLKCRMRMTQAHRPNVSYCRAGGNHNWYSLGRTGPLIHVCLKCRMRVNSAARPSVSYCGAGGNHNWHLLGKWGRDNYRCRKCGLLLRTSGRPSVSYCEAGGNHNWFKY